MRVQGYTENLLQAMNGNKNIRINPTYRIDSCTVASDSPQYYDENDLCFPGAKYQFFSVRQYVFPHHSVHIRNVPHNCKNNSRLVAPQSLLHTRHSSLSYAMIEKASLQYDDTPEILFFIILKSISSRSSGILRPESRLIIFGV